MAEPITNTTAETRVLTDGLPGMIEATEANGAREVAAANGTRLPTDGREAWELLLAEGGGKGSPVPDDPIWTEGSLPDGWRVETTDHSMWTRVLDDNDVERIDVFYKAAFYDRRCLMKVSAGEMKETTR